MLTKPESRILENRLREDARSANGAMEILRLLLYIGYLSPRESNAIYARWVRHHEAAGRRMLDEILAKPPDE